MSFSLTILVEKSRGYRIYRPGLWRAEFLEERGRDWEEIQHYERVIPSLATEKNLEARTGNWAMRICF